MRLVAAGSFFCGGKKPLVGKVLLWVQASRRKRLHTGTDSKWSDTVFFQGLPRAHRSSSHRSSERHQAQSKRKAMKPIQVQKLGTKPTQAQNSKVSSPRSRISPHRSRSGSNEAQRSRSESNEAHTGPVKGIEPEAHTGQK